LNVVADLRTQGIIFDLDGTIVDSRNAYLEAAKTAFRALGKEPPAPEVLLEIPRRLELKQPIISVVGFDSRCFLDLYLKTFYAMTKERTKLITNIPVTLEKLSGKVKLAMVTMRYVPRQIILEELEYFGIAQYFLHVVTALDTLEPKPSPEALIKTSHAIDVPIQNCVIVGDSLCDIRAGKAAGAKTVAVLSGLFSCEELARENPDFILKDVAAMQNFVGK